MNRYSPTTETSRYCWTHGFACGKDHTSATCRSRAVGHVPTATAVNHHNGSVFGYTSGTSKNNDPTQKFVKKTGPTQSDTNPGAVNLPWHPGPEISRRTNKLINFNLNTTHKLLSPCPSFYTTSPTLIDSGSSGHYLMSPTSGRFLNKPSMYGTSKITNPVKIPQIHAILPNGSTIKSQGSTYIDLPHVPPAAATAHIFPSLSHNSLLSVCLLCKHGCKTTFDSKHVLLIKINWLLQERGTLIQIYIMSSYQHHLLLHLQRVRYITWTPSHPC